jgi:hypothetical protein
LLAGGCVAVQLKLLPWPSHAKEKQVLKYENWSFHHGLVIKPFWVTSWINSEHFRSFTDLLCPHYQTILYWINTTGLSRACATKAEGGNSSLCCLSTVIINEMLFKQTESVPHAWKTPPLLSLQWHGKLPSCHPWQQISKSN